MTLLLKCYFKRYYDLSVIASVISVNLFEVTLLLMCYFSSAYKNILFITKVFAMSFCYKSVHNILLQELIQGGIEINPPPPPPAFNSKEKAFERWKTEIEMRSEVIELTKQKGYCSSVIPS